MSLRAGSVRQHGPGEATLQPDIGVPQRSSARETAVGLQGCFGRCAASQ